MKVLTLDELKVFLEKVDDEPMLAFPIKEPELKDLVDIYAACQAHQDELKKDTYQRCIRTIANGVRIAEEYGLNPKHELDDQAYQRHQKREG